jgi:hypothetical protein
MPQPESEAPAARAVEVGLLTEVVAATGAAAAAAADKARVAAVQAGRATLWSSGYKQQERKPDHMKTRMAVAFSICIMAVGVFMAAPPASAGPQLPGTSFCEKVKNIINKYRPGTPTRTDSLGHIKPSKPDANS